MYFCHFCGAASDSQASICPQCHRPLHVSGETPPPDLQVVSITQSVPETPQPSTGLPPESLGRYVTLVSEQQQELLRLRQQIQEGLEQQRVWVEEQLEAQQQEVSVQLAKKEDKVLLPERPQLTRWQGRGMGIFLILAGLAFIVNLTLIILYSRPSHRIDALTLGSTALVVFGGFYLAYDLLGRQDGPLVRLTASVTYALIGTIGASMASAILIAQSITIVSISSRFQHFDADPAAGLSPDLSSGLFLLTRSALFCLFWGALIGLSGDLLAKRYKLSRLAWLKTSLFELLGCLVFWILLFTFAIPLLILPSPSGGPTYDPTSLWLGGFIIAVLLALGTFVFVRLYRSLIIYRLPRIQISHPRPYWAVFIISTLLFFCLPVLPVTLLVVFSQPEGTIIVGGLGVTLSMALSGTLATFLAPLPFGG